MGTLCPELEAHHNNIITKDSLDWLKLSTYERTVGTKVRAECLVPEGYYLVGSRDLECLATGVWNNSKPRCVKNLDINNESTGTKSLVDTSDLNSMPLIIIFSMLCLFFICCAIIVAYIGYYRRKNRLIREKYMLQERLIADDNRSKRSYDDYEKVFYVNADERSTLDRSRVQNEYFVKSPDYSTKESFGSYVPAALRTSMVNGGYGIGKSGKSDFHLPRAKLSDTSKTYQTINKY